MAAHKPWVLYRTDPLLPLDVITSWKVHDLDVPFQILPKELTALIYEYGQPLQRHIISYLTCKGRVFVHCQEGDTIERLIQDILLMHPNVAGHLGWIRWFEDNLDSDRHGEFMGPYDRLTSNHRCALGTFEFVVYHTSGTDEHIFRLTPRDSPVRQVRIAPAYGAAPHCIPTKQCLVCMYVFEQ
jgi:hypothetical protein